jgi:hypothetical protein
MSNIVANGVREKPFQKGSNKIAIEVSSRKLALLRCCLRKKII